MTLAQERDVWSEYQHATGADRERIEEELVKENEGLAHFVLKRYRNPHEDYEDLLQIAMMALLVAVRGFKPEMDLKFSTYAEAVIRTSLLNHYREGNAHKRKANTLTFSLNAPVRDEEGKMEWADLLQDENTIVEEQATDTIITEKILRIAKQHFDEREALVFQYRFPKYGEPVEFTAIGKEFGITGAGVINIYRNLIYKLAQCCNGADPAVVFAPRRRSWTKEENSQLNEMLLAGRTRKDIYIQFSDRTKAALDQKITNVKRKLKKEGLL